MNNEGIRQRDSGGSRKVSIPQYTPFKGEWDEQVIAGRGYPGQRYTADYDLNEKRLSGLSWVSTIGVVISAPSAFGMITAQSFFGDSSQAGIEKLRHIGTILVWASGMYSISTVLVVSIQLLYAGPGFGTTLTIGRSPHMDVRGRYPDNHRIRGWIVWLTELMVWMAVSTQVAGTILIAEAAKVFSWNLVMAFEAVFAVVILGQGAIWGLQSMVDRQPTWDKCMKVLNYVNPWLRKWLENLR